MALQEIKPKYIKWLTSNQDISVVITMLKDEMSTLNNGILKGKNDKTIEENINDIRKKLLYTNLLFNEKMIEQPNKDWSKQKETLENLTNNMNFIDKYEQNNILVAQKKNINIFTWFSVIFLPLTLITGYYGMNFRSMGSPSNNEGPFSWKYGQLWVFLLFIISIIFTTIIFKKFYN